ncbi:hypothetical protein GWK48_09830 [Metallosphaera tengchongensis]|uniref:Uncharacterized protein n=1 Tax=Metallosphaera tengchongensis TaxID=1532350 RepID=A0A6N0NXP7_9CREN|nr:hypothetical protein [Metallosphaera tengchongensis]QKR00643.1 hypothetical protein GWK48_09830 [Metallosphaera tengchongensis]
MLKEEDFLDFQHYTRYRLAQRLKRKVLEIGEYRLYLLGGQSRRGDAYVMGRDSSTGKYFVMQVFSSFRYLDKGPEQITERDLRAMMGFDYHAYENFKYRDGIVIRLQGDLVMRVERSFERTRLSESDDLWFLPSFTLLMNQFIRDRLYQEPDLVRLERLVTIYSEIMNFLTGSVLPRESLRKVLSIKRELESRISEISEFPTVEVKLRVRTRRRPKDRGEKDSSGFPLVEIENVTRDNDSEWLGNRLGSIIFVDAYSPNVKMANVSFLDVNRGLDMYRRDLVKRYREEYVEFIKSKEERLNIMLGHYTTPHSVRMKGVYIRGSMSPTVLVLEPGSVTLTHPEHGTEEYFIPKPSLVSFELMGNNMNFF